MDELELFEVWFEKQKDFEFITDEEGIWEKTPFSQVIKSFYKERNDIITKLNKTCSHCKYADLYIPYWTYPYSDPRCCITKKSIKPDDTCDNFKMIGRSGR